jgi:ribosome-associated protein
LTEEIETDQIKKQSLLTFYKSRGPGGQRKNKRETAVKVTHIPTGKTARATESRSQAANRELAFERLFKKLENLNKKKPARVPTKKPLRVKRKEMEQKRKHSVKKKERVKSPFGDDV